ncbi:nucleolar protein 12-domain-containing protein [Cantharellus anzutake]|uniref:nucleolar protein 12-domain-containing protein n=1 Tax=Cantharellus anzutake TaxID=1750568 RepID=UPI0019038B26|nr:nucleolar protein 12-domain-containing protein [Cantharellus anzutake]KAF8337617.1 nucleolar protein 12-domain-containing protein [Cantharellus anzutake]
MAQHLARRRKAGHDREKKGETKEVLFDERARKDYLTGFHKRNLAKKEARAAKMKERQRQERLELRREKRRSLAERAVANAKAVERAYGNDLSSGDDQPNEDDSSSSSNENNEEHEYEGEEELATVTIDQDFNISTAGEFEYRPLEADCLDGASTDGVPVPRSCSQPISSLPSAPSDKSPRKKIRKFTYETKAARVAVARKQKARQKEKMERGRIKSKSGSRSRSSRSK